MIRAGLVHGDLRSHVILSPPCIVAGGNHVCERIALAINVAYEDHGDLPRTASVQLDNASVNHNMLVFGFVSLYVMLGIFDKFRVRSASSQEALARASSQHLRKMRVDRPLPHTFACSCFLPGLNWRTMRTTSTTYSTPSTGLR